MIGNEHIDIILKQITEKNEKPFDFQDLMFRFTLDSIGKVISAN